MTLEAFRWQFKQVNGVELNGFAVFKQRGKWILAANGDTTAYKRLEDLANAEVKGKSVCEHIAGTKKIVHGAISVIKEKKPSGPKRSAFDHARGGGGWGATTQDFPSRFNTGDKAQTEEKMASKFVSMHANSKEEHAITIDERGYVTQYNHGDKTSVGIMGRKGEMVYHNHPGGSDGMGHSFSDSDLILTAKDQSRGIIAVAPEGTYSFVKGRKFDAAGFYNAVKNAKVPANLDYDAGVAHWMKQNAKKYDFTYKFTPASKRAEYKPYKEIGIAIPF